MTSYESNEVSQGRLHGAMIDMHYITMLSKLMSPVRTGCSLATVKEHCTC